MDRRTPHSGAYGPHNSQNPIYLEGFEDFFHPNFLMGAFFVLSLQFRNHTLDSDLHCRYCDLRVGAMVLKVASHIITA